LERGQGYWISPGIDLCVASAVWRSTISSIAELPQRLEAIVEELGEWPSTPEAGLVLSDKDGEWKCFLSPSTT
jgi:hypothetical protein